MRQVGRRESEMGVKRIFYEDDKGNYAQKIVNNPSDHAALLRHNQDMAHEYRPNSASNARTLINIPPDIILKEMERHGVHGGIAGRDSIDFIARKIFANTEEYGYLRCVPLTYRL